MAVKKLLTHRNICCPDLTLTRSHNWNAPHIERTERFTACLSSHQPSHSSIPSISFITEEKKNNKLRVRPSFFGHSSFLPNSLPYDYFIKQMEL
jgi:hypothetical protein